MIEKTVIEFFCIIESEKRYLKLKDINIDKTFIKKIRQSIAPFTPTGCELNAYQHLLRIRAEAYFRDPLILQKIKNMAQEILKLKELN